MYAFTLLDHDSLPNFNSFISDKIQKALSNIDPENLIIFGALKENTPIGICVATVYPILSLSEFLHIEVALEHRNHHIGRTLIAKTQEKAISIGAKIFTLVYPLEEPETAAIEKILAANHWKGSRPFLIRALFNPETFNAPIVQLNHKYPQGYKEFLWKNLKEKQKNDLLLREKKNHFSSIFSPFREKEIQEPLNSLGLQYKGRVVGWLITHRIDPKTIRYSCLYIEPSLKFRGVAMKLLADSMLLHMQKPTKWALIEIPYLQVPPSWIHFIERRILPSAVKVSRLQQGWHTL